MRLITRCSACDKEFDPVTNENICPDCVLDIENEYPINEFEQGERYMLDKLVNKLEGTPNPNDMLKKLASFIWNEDQRLIKRGVK